MDEDNSYIRALHQRVPTIATIESRHMPFDEETNYMDDDDAYYMDDDSLADNMSAITETESYKHSNGSVSDNEGSSSFKLDVAGRAPSTEEILEDVVAATTHTTSASAGNSVGGGRSSGNSISSSSSKSMTGSRSSRSSRAGSKISTFSQGGSQGGNSRSTKGTKNSNADATFDTTFENMSKGTKDTTFEDMSTFSGTDHRSKGSSFCSATANSYDYESSLRRSAGRGGGSSVASARSGRSGGTGRGSDASSKLSAKQAEEAYSKICGGFESTRGMVARSVSSGSAASLSSSSIDRNATTTTTTTAGNGSSSSSTNIKKAVASSSAVPAVESARRGRGAASPTSLGSSSRTTRETQQTLIQNTASIMSAYIKSFDSAYSAAQTIQGRIIIGTTTTTTMMNEEEDEKKQQVAVAENEVLRTQEAEIKRLLSVESFEEKIGGTTMEIKEVASFVTSQGEKKVAERNDLEKLETLAAKTETEDLAQEEKSTVQPMASVENEIQDETKEEETASNTETGAESPPSSEHDETKGNAMVILCKRIPTEQYMQLEAIESTIGSFDEMESSLEEDKPKEEAPKEEAPKEEAPKGENFKLKKEAMKLAQDVSSKRAPPPSGHGSKSRLAFAKLKSKSRFFGKKKAAVGKISRSNNVGNNSVSDALDVNVVKKVKDENEIELSYGSPPNSNGGSGDGMMKAITEDNSPKSDTPKGATSNDDNSPPAKDVLMKGMMPRVQSKCESTKSNNTNDTENVTLESQEVEAKEGGEENGLLENDGNDAPLNNSIGDVKNEEFVVLEAKTFEVIEGKSGGTNNNSMFGKLFACDPFQCGGKSYVNASSHGDLLETGPVLLYDDQVDEALNVEVFNDWNNVTRVGFFAGPVDMSPPDEQKQVPQQVPQQQAEEGDTRPQYRRNSDDGKRVTPNAVLKTKLEPGFEVRSERKGNEAVDLVLNKTNGISHKLEQKRTSGKDLDDGSAKTKRNGLRTRLFGLKNKGKKTAKSQGKSKKKDKKKNSKKKKDASLLDQLEVSRELEKAKNEELKKAAQAAAIAAEAAKAAEASELAKAAPEPTQQEISGNMWDNEGLEGLDGDDLDELFEGLD